MYYCCCTLIEHDTIPCVSWPCARRNAHSSGVLILLGYFASLLQKSAAKCVRSCSLTSLLINKRYFSVSDLIMLSLLAIPLSPINNEKIVGACLPFHSRLAASFKYLSEHRPCMFKVLLEAVEAFFEEARRQDILFSAADSLLDLKLCPPTVIPLQPGTY